MNDSEGESSQNSGPHRAVPTSRSARLLKLGSAAGSFALKGLGAQTKRLFGKEVDASDWLNAKNAAQLVARLSEMRGAAMKLGQMVSMEGADILPKEFTEVLAQLRNQSWRMPPEQLEQVMVGAYGSDWRDNFDHFDPEPIAAASIGQVHQAILPKGDEVAIKVQYPGVRESIDSDVDNLRSLLQLTKIIPSHLDPTGITDELKKQLHEEADYLREADALQKVGDALRADESLRTDAKPWFRVPVPNHELTRPDVLVMSFEGGQNLFECAKGASQELRDRLGEHLLALLYRELFHHAWVQTDPNFANYLYDPDEDQIVLLDFGAFRNIDESFRAGYHTVLSRAWHKDRDGVRLGLMDLGFLQPDTDQQAIEDLLDLVWLAMEPIKEGGFYHFGHTGLGARGRETLMRMRRSKTKLPSPPPTALFFQRKLAGVFLMLKKLEARVDVRSLFEPYLGA